MEKNPQVVALSEAIGRDPGAVKMKLENFKKFDPDYTVDGKKGLGNTGRLDGEIVLEFINNWGDLAWEAENARRKYSIKQDSEIIAGEFDIPEGKYKERMVKIRCGDRMFRNMLLAQYRRKCCITGLAIEDLLKASHIKPWAVSDDATEKVNPQNGLLLNPFFDLAFDKGYITIDLDYKVILSKEIKHTNESTRLYFEKYEGSYVDLPSNKLFYPGKRFIEYHNDHVFGKKPIKI
ncbi:MAG: HNH endonuclease [Methanomassiliicoccaceae archaeon]|nr:HNH endonuclease [Methanomassiliicoccaceae archaeon]